MHDQLLPEIEDLIVEQCGVPVLLIQCRWGLPYSAAQVLLDKLAEQGLVSAANERGLRSPDGRLLDRILAVPGPQWSPMRRYVRRLYQITWYVFENLEEGHSCDTRSLNLLNPAPAVRAVEIRAFIEGALKQDVPPVAAAQTLHDWLREKGHIDGPCLLRSVLEREFARVIRPRREVRDPAEMAERAFLRLARYLREMNEENPQIEGAMTHSRAFEFFIPAAFIAAGEAAQLAGRAHREHVVPCAYLRNQALRFMEQGSSDEEVASFLRRCLAIVRISRTTAKHLDSTAGRGLKTGMPPDWDPHTGDIFARLRLANIEFSMAETVQG